MKASTLLILAVAGYLGYKLITENQPRANPGSGTDYTKYQDETSCKSAGGLWVNCPPGLYCANEYTGSFIGPRCWPPQ